jgi:YkoY family integral membrane protein
MDIMEILHEFLGPDLKAAGIVILNLLLIETLLSVDNAAVLATMVMDLPKEQRAKALKYGIIGAYVFRGLSLIFAAFLVQIAWLKGLGGLYLLWLAVDYFWTKATPQKEDDLLNKKEKGWFKRMKNRIGLFWSTVILVEIMDLAFSIDNVFAAVAFTKNIYLIIIGVFIGILAMRFVAQSFVKIMEKFPFLERAAFLVIAVLGMKLILSFFAGMGWLGGWGHLIDSHNTDLYTSILTVGIFFLPLITSLLFNYPKRKKLSHSQEEGEPHQG